MYIDYACKGFTWVQILNVPMPKGKTNWMEKRKLKKIKKKNQVQTCAVVVRAEWVRCGGTWSRRPSLARMAREERPRNRICACGPHTAEARRRKGISRNPKKETFGYCRKSIVNWPPGARALTSKPRPISLWKSLTKWATAPFSRNRYLPLQNKT